MAQSLLQGTSQSPGSTIQSSTFSKLSQTRFSVLMIESRASLWCTGGKGRCSSSSQSPRRRAAAEGCRGCAATGGAGSESASHGRAESQGPCSAGGKICLIPNLHAVTCTFGACVSNTACSLVSLGDQQLSSAQHVSGISYRHSRVSWNQQGTALHNTYIWCHEWMAPLTSPSLNLMHCGPQSTFCNDFHRC